MKMTDLNEVIQPHPPRQILASEGRPVTPISELKPGVKNLNCHFVILEKGLPRVVANGHQHCVAKVADESGSINLTLWDQAAEYLQPGDVCTLRLGSTSVYKGSMTLNVGKQAEILKTGTIMQAVNLAPDMSAYSEELDKLFSKNNTEDVEAAKRQSNSGTTPTKSTA